MQIGSIVFHEDPCNKSLVKNLLEQDGDTIRAKSNTFWTQTHINLSVRPFICYMLKL